MKERYCYIIAGPNGAGKTTFAMDILPDEFNCKNFVNADLIAAGLSPFAPELEAFEAGKLMLHKIEACLSQGDSFAFETTLSGKGYLRKIDSWKSKGYSIILYYFNLPSIEMAVERVKYRVMNGGHDIPVDVIKRRFKRSKENLNLYKQKADSWTIFDSSGKTPILLETFSNET